MENINNTLQELKKYKTLQKELESQIKALEEVIKAYMTENGLQELVSDDLLTVCRYKEVISKRFDTTAFKKSEWAELYDQYCKESKSMRFTIN